MKNLKPNLMARNTLKYRRIDAERRAELRAAWNRPVVWPLLLVLALLVLALLPAVWGYRRHERMSALEAGR